MDPSRCPDVDRSLRTWPRSFEGRTLRFVEGSMRRWVVTNRRRALRHAVQISCQVVRERDFRLVGDRIVDLSTSGMLVTPADPVLPGERIIASFRRPNSTYCIDVEGTVALARHG